MEEEVGMIEIDSDVIGQDLDDIDPYAEYTIVDNNEDDCNILFE